MGLKTYTLYRALEQHLRVTEIDVKLSNIIAKKHQKVSNIFFNVTFKDKVWATV